jgi:hypothetical protein
MHTHKPWWDNPVPDWFMIGLGVILVAYFIFISVMEEIQSRKRRKQDNRIYTDDFDWELTLQSTGLISILIWGFLIAKTEFPVFVTLLLAILAWVIQLIIVGLICKMTSMILDHWL